MLVAIRLERGSAYAVRAPSVNEVTAPPAANETATVLASHSAYCSGNCRRSALTQLAVYESVMTDLVMT